MKKNITLAEQFQNRSKYNKKKIKVRDEIETRAQIYMTRSHSWLGTGTSIENDGVKLVLSTKCSPLGEMIW